jgi:hypothetical protein
MVSSLQAYQPKFCSHFSSSPCVLHAPPISSSLIWSPDNIWQRIQIMKLLNMQFSPASCHFILLRSKYSPQLPVLKLCSSLNVRDQVSHPYKTSKIIVLYILVFIFLDKHMGRYKILDCMKASSLLLMSSWMQFWVVYVVPIYLNCSTFWKDLF